MTPELKKYLIIFHVPSRANDVVANDFDATFNGRPVFTCSAFDTSNTDFAIVRRIPKDTNSTDKNVGHQTWWFHKQDIAAVFQFDGSQQAIGFVQDR